MSTQTHLMTARELFYLTDDGLRHELLKGELLTMTPPGEPHAASFSKLHHLLSNYIYPRNLGRLYGELGFIVETDPDTVLAPDMAFIRSPRADQISDGYRVGVPDLVVEIISRHDRKRWVEDKTARWLSAGAEAVWLMNPRTRTVEIRLASGKRRLFAELDILEDDEVVVGFRARVSDIFK